MTHPKYSAKYLLKKGKSYCKLIAQELGVPTPEGDKRETLTWVNAIIEHQANVQPVEIEKPEATIEYVESDDNYLESYQVVSGGVVVCDGFRTYLKAENWASQNYTLVSPQEVAQAEFEAELEVQVKEKEDAPERPRQEPEAVDDYLFHDDPVPHRGSGRDKLPQIGDTFIVGSFILRCSQLLTPDHAITWDVYDGNQPIGEILMNYAGFWRNNLSLSLLTTPYEVVADLAENAHEFVAD